MIAELQSLIDAIGDAPHLAVGALIAYLVYKLLLAGSIVTAVYKGWLAGMGVLESKMQNEVRLKELEKDQQETVRQQIDKKWIDEICISGCEKLVVAQITRIAGVKTSRDGGMSRNYIHSQDVFWLQEAIDEKLAREGRSKE